MEPVVGKSPHTSKRVGKAIMKRERKCAARAVFYLVIHSERHSFISVRRAKPEPDR